MEYVIDPEKLEAWDIHPGVTAKVVGRGEKMTAMWTKWEPGSVFPPHVHPHEQIGLCLSGESIFTIDGRDYVVKAGDVYNIPSNVPHGERNEGDVPVVFIEWFAPVREDLLRGRFEQKMADSPPEGNED